jgi:hypothetical protein
MMMRLIVCLAFCLVGELLVAYTWPWTASGEDIVSEFQGEPRRKAAVFGSGPARTYSIHQVRNLRAAGFLGPTDSTKGGRSPGNH